MKPKVRLTIYDPFHKGRTYYIKSVFRAKRAVVKALKIKHSATLSLLNPKTNRYRKVKKYGW